MTRLRWAVLIAGCRAELVRPSGPINNRKMHQSYISQGSIIARTNGKMKYKRKNQVTATIMYKRIPVL